MFDADPTTGLGAGQPLVLLPDALLADAIAPIEVMVQEGLTVFSVPASGRLSPSQLRDVFGPRIRVGVHGVASDDDAKWVLNQEALFALEETHSIRLSARKVSTFASALTPTEARAVRGAGGVLIEPADAFGVGYAKSLRQILGDVPLVARGIDGMATARAWRAVGAMVAWEKWLLPDGLPVYDLARLRMRARDVVQLHRG